MAKSNSSFNSLELSAFCNQLAIILNSGIPVAEGITIMLEDTESETEADILNKISDKLNETGSIYIALKAAEIFPTHMINMIQVGEETGTLDTVIETLAINLEREYTIKRTIRSTITYPVIMMSMMLAVIVVLLVNVMPVFNQVFIQLGTEMTGLSAGLMAIGAAINNYAIFFTLLLLLIIIIAVLAIKTSKGRNLALSFACKFKSPRRLCQATFSCRLASVMALTLSSGLYPLRGLELARALTDNPEFTKKLDNCKEQMENGCDLAKAFHDNGIFTGIYSQMATIGERTGSLDKAMTKIADLYQEEIDNRTNNFLAVLEPTLVAVLSVIVGVILLSVMIPLLGIMAAL